MFNNMRKKLSALKNFLISGLYFTVIFLAALTIATQALARRVNTYESIKKPLFFSIDKEDIIISNSVAGRVEEVGAVTGQHVQKGDLLFKLVDDNLEQKMASLEKVADKNLSAKTELDLIKARTSEYEMRAPRNGVIYEIHAAEGSYLNTSTPIITMFADSNVKLIGNVNEAQYTEIQKNKNMDVYSSRFNQTYKIIFKGVGRVYAANQNEESKYEMLFQFADSEEGAAFIEGENLEIISKNNNGMYLRPSKRVAEFWNAFIIGK